MPSRALGSRVAAIDVIESDEAQVRVLPSAGAVLGLQFKGRVSSDTGPLSLLGVTGIQARPRTYEYAPGTASILVRFTPQGAMCLGVPASELTGQSAALTDLLPARDVERLHAQVLEARSTAAKVALVERFLVALPFARDARISHALEWLEGSAAESARVAAVARRLGLSERQLERRMLERVGITPKRYATLRRWERVLQLLRTSASLTSVAHAAGYHDQSHFVHDFRRFTGTTPSNYLAAR